MLARVDPQSVSVRDLSEADVPFVLDYWFRSPPGFIESLGADPTKLPSEAQFGESLRQRIRANAGADRSKLNSLAILHEGRFAGFHNLNPYPQACRVFLDRFDLERIVFKTPVQNAGAIRVKEKLGYRYLGEERVDFGILRPGTLAKIYELTRDEAGLGPLPKEI